MGKRVRCGFEGCQKKLNLIDQSIGKCRCKGVYCSNHRLNKKHQCTFDLVKENKEILAKNNPVVCKEKVIKI